ncbi:MAG: hypothetical protein QNJ98_07360 [Planctomycetota bacterium]|nr:hypothetical protein [Planctomycetota bacterium]
MKRTYDAAWLDQIGRAGIRFGRVLLMGGFVALIVGWPVVAVLLIVNGFAGIAGGRRELSRARHLERQTDRTAAVFE